MGEDQGLLWTSPLAEYGEDGMQRVGVTAQCVQLVGETHSLLNM